MLGAAESKRNKPMGLVCSLGNPERQQLKGKQAGKILGSVEETKTTHKEIQRLDLVSSRSPNSLTFSLSSLELPPTRHPQRLPPVSHTESPDLTSPLPVPLTPPSASFRQLSPLIHLIISSDSTASSIGPHSTAIQEEILSEFFHENTGTQHGLGLCYCYSRHIMGKYAFAVITSLP